MPAMAIHGLCSIAPQTASATRPPGRSSRRVSAKAAAGFGISMVRHQHVAEPAEHAVYRIVVELDALGVDHPVVDVLEAEFAAAAAGGVQHRRREVAGDQAAAPTDDRGRLEAGVADPCRKLEERVSLVWVERAHHP